MSLEDLKKQAKQLGAIDEEVKKCGNDKSCLHLTLAFYLTSIRQEVHHI